MEGRTVILEGNNFVFINHDGTREGIVSGDKPQWKIDKAASQWVLRGVIDATIVALTEPKRKKKNWGTTIPQTPGPKPPAPGV